jgi:hypothetical protein
MWSASSRQQISLGMSAAVFIPTSKFSIRKMMAVGIDFSQQPLILSPCCGVFFARWLLMMQTLSPFHHG